MTNDERGATWLACTSLGETCLLITKRPHDMLLS